MPSKSPDARLAKLKAAKAQAETEKQWAFDHQAEVYNERDMLVRALSKAHPSHLMRHRNAKNGNIKPVVCIHTPVGNLAWTLTGGDEFAKQYYRHLEWTDNHWDGCTAKERFKLLEQI